MANDGRTSASALIPEYNLDTSEQVVATSLGVEYDQPALAVVVGAELLSEYDQQPLAAIAGQQLLVEYGQRPPAVPRASGYIPFQGWNFPVVNRNFQGSKGRTKWGQWTPKGQGTITETIADLTALLGLVGWTYYDASVGVVYDGSNRAVTWAPAAGDTPAAIFGQPDAAQRPFAASINGRPALFSGYTPTGWMEIPNAVKWTLPPTGGGLIYTIIQDQSTLTAAAGNGVLGDISGVAGMFMISSVLAAPGFGRTGLRLNAPTTYFSDTSTALPKNAGLLFGLDREPASVSSRINENAAPPVAAGPYNLTTNPLKVFRYNENNGSVPFGLTVGGILVVRHGVTPSTSAQLRQVLYKRWKIAP